MIKYRFRYFKILHFTYLVLEHASHIKAGIFLHFRVQNRQALYLPLPASFWAQTSEVWLKRHKAFKLNYSFLCKNILTIVIFSEKLKIFLMNMNQRLRKIMILVIQNCVIDSEYTYKILFLFSIKKQIKKVKIINVIRQLLTFNTDIEQIVRPIYRRRRWQRYYFHWNSLILPNLHITLSEGFPNFH